MKKIIFLVLIFLCYTEPKVQATDQPYRVFTLEHAIHPDQIQWGLMGRTSLPENHGMLFHMNTHPNKISVWMFNCYIDLSIAYLDDQYVIQEIHELKAYPEKMDPKRPLNSPKEIFRVYPTNDPIIQFFKAHAVEVPQNINILLEMNKNWFKNNGIRVGDKVHWKDNQGWVLLEG